MSRHAWKIGIHQVAGSPALFADELIHSLEECGESCVGEER